MKKFSPISKMAIVLVLLLSGCTNFPKAIEHGGNPFTQPFNYQKAQALPEDQTTFKGALISEYKGLASKEGNIWSDWFDSDFFARKSLEIANNNEASLSPEDPSLWRFNAKGVKQFEPSRSNLIAALAEGRDQFPVLAAKAQSRFDCWVEEQEEGWQNDEIAKCKGEFNAALAELQKALAGKPADLATLYTIFFDFDSAELTAVGEQVLQVLAQDWASKGVSFDLVGHTDSSGSAAYNIKLSQRRANTVKSYISKLGIDASSVTTTGLGESSLAVQTGDGVREPRNRRVVVTIKK